MSDFERLAYEAGLRALDKQEALLEELRSRTGILLAASSVATSLLGESAFKDAPVVGTVVALGAFLVSIGASVYILLPKNELVFSLVGPALYEQLYGLRTDLAEVYRRLAYDLDGFWLANDEKMQRLFLAYRVAAAALVVEILALVALLSDTIS